MNGKVTLSNIQIENLAQPLVKIITNFFEKDLNIKNFEKWLKEKEVNNVEQQKNRKHV